MSSENLWEAAGRNFGKTAMLLDAVKEMVAGNVVFVARPMCATDNAWGRLTGGEILDEIRAMMKAMHENDVPRPLVLGPLPMLPVGKLPRREPVGEPNNRHARRKAAALRGLR